MQRKNRFGDVSRWVNPWLGRSIIFLSLVNYMGWEEKRQHKRAYIKLAVEYRGKNSWQMIETRDISVAGMFVVTDTVEPANTEVEIMFEVETADKHKQFVYAKGVVAWNRPKDIRDREGNVQPAGMGIKFTKLNPLSAKEFINEVVKKLN